MAKRGEIDPWNVDVVEVADKFLLELERAKRLDLRISGRVLLYAAILVRMKSEILTNELIGVDEEESEEDETSTFDSDFFAPDFIDEFVGDEEIEDEIIKSLIATGSRKRKPRRYTTLRDLIEELEKAERRRRLRRRRRRITREVSIDPLETPHEENIEDWIKEMESVIAKVVRGRGYVLFSEICGEDVVKSYVSVLHLAFRRKIEIEQERIFESDILLRWIDEGNS